MFRKQLALVSLVVVSILALVLGACAPGRSSSGKPAVQPAPEARPEQPADGTSGAVGGSESFAGRADSAPAATSPDQRGMPAGAADKGAASSQAQGAPAQPAPQGQNQQPWDRMIIRNGTITLVSDDVAGTVNTITGIITSVDGGHIFGSNIRFEGGRQIATITLRVPGPAFDDVLGRLRRLAAKPEDVTNEQVSSQDVTEEFVDLQSQVRNLQAQEQRYLQLLDKAQNIQEILLVQQRLSDTRMQIERLQGRMNFLERRAEFGTITVSVTARSAEKKAETKGWDPQRTFSMAWASVAVVLRSFADMLIWLSVYSIILVPLGLGIALIIWLLRRATRPAAPPTPAPPSPAQP
jgi:hypothetical protein